MDVRHFPTSGNRSEDWFTVTLYTTYKHISVGEMSNFSFISKPKRISITDTGRESLRTQEMNNLPKFE